MKKSLVTLFTVGMLYGGANAQYHLLLKFNNAKGSTPFGSLTLLGNKLYGLTRYGGANNYGNIFSINTDGTGANSFYSFDSACIASFMSTKLLYANHKFYGMTEYSGKYESGYIFCIDSSGANFKDIFDFNYRTTGYNPYGGLIISNGRLYGMTMHDYYYGDGAVFGIDTDGTHYKDLHLFSGSDGSSPYGSLILINNDQLYGMTSFDGIHGNGNIFSIDTSGGDFQDRWDFDGTSGSYPWGNLILLGHRLYGMTSAGGINNRGVIFSLDTNAYNNSYLKLWDFYPHGDTNGSQPEGDLTYHGNVFYGMTPFGGNGCGNIFHIDTDGTRYRDIWDFSDGCRPYGSITFSGNTIYGTTMLGGTNDMGIVFSDSLIIQVSITDTGTTCNGGSNGHATAYVSGGTPPFTYKWTGGSTTNKATGLSAGSYSVKVIDNTGLVAADTITITQPVTGPSITIAFNTNEFCNGAQTASALVNPATGGEPPYTYNWSPNGGTNLVANNLAAGTYTITATDNHGCTDTASVSITQPATAVSITMDSNTNEACYGDQTASAEANAAIGGTAPYRYYWSPGGDTNLIESGLSAGIYTITATDNNGCIATTSVSITQPAAALSINIASSINEACHGDQTAHATANVPTGGTSPYTYNWSPVGGNSLSASNLATGTYTITTTDNHGCTASASISITQPATALGGITYSAPDTGNSSGSAAINPVGGTLPYDYSWSPGSETTDSITHLGPGSYTVTVTDKNGCTYSTIVVVDNTTGITDINSIQNEQILVHPNPSAGVFTFQMSNYGQSANNKYIKVYNMLGQQAFSQLNIQSSTFNINLGSQPDGLYMYRIISETGDLQGQGKLLIMK